MTKRDYPTAGVTIHWDSDVCIHSATCVRSLPGVFHPDTQPWITPDAADADAIVATVEACPSGALRYTRTGSAATAEDASPPAPEAAAPAASGVTVTLSADGPYEIAGPVSIVAADGVVIKEGERLWLCRCGHSSAKPFCDGSHRKVGFADSGLGSKREKDLPSGQ